MHVAHGTAAYRRRFSAGYRGPFTARGDKAPAFGSPSIGAPDCMLSGGKGERHVAETGTAHSVPTEAKAARSASGACGNPSGRFQPFHRWAFVFDDPRRSGRRGDQ